MGPEQSMQIQSNLASTIAMALDECPSSVADRDYVQRSVARTTRCRKRCKDEMARLNSLPDSIKNLITVTDDAREASERGIATASQESVDENNGRLTVIQGHTYTMNENVKLIGLLGDKILEAINIIRVNTEYCKRLDNIDKQISSMRNKLDEIGDDGLRVK